MAVVEHLQLAVEQALQDANINADAHMVLNTSDDDRNVRINSRDYPRTSGDSSAIQSKPNMTGTGTASVSACELSPRFASGIAGNTIIGLKVNPILKGAAGGDLSGDFRCIECRMESDSGSTRTVDGNCYALHAMNSMHGTCTGGAYVIGVDVAGGNLAWIGLIHASASGAGGVTVSSDGMFKDPESDTEAGYIVAGVGSTTYQIPFYASS